MKVVVLLTEHTNSSQYTPVVLVQDNQRCMALFPIWCAENVHQDKERLQVWPHQAEGDFRIYESETWKSFRRNWRKLTSFVWALSADNTVSRCNTQHATMERHYKLFGMDRKPTRTSPDPCARLILLWVLPIEVYIERNCIICNRSQLYKFHRTVRLDNFSSYPAFCSSHSFTCYFVTCIYFAKVADNRQQISLKQGWTRESKIPEQINNRNLRFKWKKRASEILTYYRPSANSNEESNPLTVLSIGPFFKTSLPSVVVTSNPLRFLNWSRNGRDGGRWLMTIWCCWLRYNWE